MIANILASYKKNRTGISLMIISSICACIGQLLWKLSATGQIIYLFEGFIFYGIGAGIMTVAYKHGSLSVLQPILSINYVLSLILGHCILYEKITDYKIIGVLLLIIGVGLICGGDE